MILRALCAVAGITACARAAEPATQPVGAAWPMWGGSPSRNAVSRATGALTQWDLETRRNIKWVAELGTYSYGGPVIADGKVYVGTNNARAYRPHSPGDKGCLLCFEARTGQLLWQATHDKLPSGRANDWPEQGIASTPQVDGDRVYYVSNRCELVCADAAGFRDGENDGPYRKEKFTEPQDADFVWILDMIGTLGVYPRNLAACSPVGAGDLIFVCTGNGIDDAHETPPKPDAPSFVAVDKRSGRVRWQRNDPGRGILNGQWSSPAYGVIAGQPQVVFGGGDGWCYAFAPATGKLLWKFDLNPQGSVYKLNGTGTKSSIVAVPVIHDDKVFLAVGDDPEASVRPGHLYAIDATQRGDITATGKVWHVGGEEFSRTVSSVVVADGLLYAVDLDGYLSCFDARTGKRHWRHDMEAGVWASPTVIDGCAWLGNTDGDLFILRHGTKREVVARHDMRSSIYTAPALVGDTLYVLTQRRLYAIGPTAVTTGPEWPLFRGNRQLTGVAGSTLPEKPAVRWKYDLGDAAVASAAIACGCVYVAGDNGKLVALDLGAGALKWQVTSDDPIASAPTVVGGLVVFGDDGGTLRACDAATGAVRWMFKAQDRIVSSANPAGDRLVFGSYDGGLYCLQIADGKLLWKYTGVEERIHGTPGIIDEYVLAAGCDARLHVVKLADGTPVRKIALTSVTGAAAAVRGARVFLGCYGGQVLGIDWQAGRVVWRYEDKERSAPFLSSAAVTDDLVIVGGRDKRVRAFDPASGKQRWEFVTRGRVDSSPVVVGQRAFFGCGDGNLYAVDLRTGREQWRFEAGSAIWATPAVGEECLVVGTEDGLVYCFGRAAQPAARP